MKKTLITLSLIGLNLSGIAFAKERLGDDNLTREFAVARKRQVRSIDYDLYFKFEKGKEDFAGKTLLKLKLAKLDTPLSIDFVGKEIRSVKVNGQAITDFKTRKGSFDLPAKVLTQDLKIEVDYIGEFNKEGMSFQRIVDPEDQAEYLYSDFEPFYAHGLFPCLDQPDLKAHFNLSVDAPKDWKVISNALEKSTKVSGDQATVQFHQGPFISPYLFFLGTGPFVEWKDQLGKLPIFIYVRKSLAKYVDAENLFKTTKAGLKFYEDYFAFPYPFPKFGLIFIPEFNWGGMENPGAISFNEKNIFRGTVTEAARHHRDGLILHEMAHMWFGDLVTMKWWNDLWLNESFATYAASLAQDRGLNFKGTWQEFLAEKGWGYWQDQLVTTHPIETDVADTRTAKSNFDGITYSKGGAALKQLHFFVGEDGFREGLRSYFKKYQFKNAIRENFISEISHASQKDLADWTHKWLQTAGPNRVHAEWQCKDHKIESFSLIQEPSTSNTLSPHRTRVGLFSLKSEKELSPLMTEDVAYSTEKTPVSHLVGKACPDFVYPNIDDQDFALFSLDPISLKSAKLALTLSPDPLMRLMLSNTLGQMVRDQKLKVTDFFDMALFALEKENDDSLLAIILGRFGDIRAFYEKYLTPSERDKVAQHIESLTWKRILEAPPKSSRQLLFFEFYIATAHTPEALSKLQSMLDKNSAPEGITLDQDRRWDLISQLAAQGFYSKFSAFDKLRTIIEAEEKKDPSATGKRNAYVARASLPELANKKNFWKEYQTPDKIPPSTLRSAVRKFHSEDHPEQSENFKNEFFEKVTSMDWTANDSYVDLYFSSLFPANICSAALLEMSETQLKNAKNLTPIARRSWLEANDELNRCIKVRAFEAQK